MSNQRERLLASKPAAQQARDLFASKYIDDQRGSAVGLGLDESGDHWTFTVLAEDPAAVGDLPHHFGEYPVEIRVTGPAKSF